MNKNTKNKINTNNKAKVKIENTGVKVYKTVNVIDDESILKALDYYEIKNVKSIILIDCIEDFYNILQFYSAPRDESKEKYVFRGFSNAMQKYCTFYRRINKEEYSYKLKGADEQKFRKFVNREVEFIRKFEQNALSSLAACITSPLDLIAAAQHYGLPTRLLDWSTSILIAMLFSLYNRDIKASYYAVFAINKQKYSTLYNLPLPKCDLSKEENSNSTNFILYEKMLYELMSVFDSSKIDDSAWTEYVRRSLSASYTEMAYNALINSKIGINTNKKDKKLIFLETNFANTRITSQRGLFQIIPELTESYAAEYIGASDLILISKKCRDKIIKICENIGLNYYAIMPDTQSIADIIKKTVSLHT